MRVAFLSALIWLVATAIFVWLALVAFPQDVSLEIFWLRIIFVVWLVTVNKAPSLVIIWIARQNSTSRYGAVLPALHIVTFIYSLVAGLALLANVFGFPLLGNPTWHLTIQFLLAAATALIALLMALAVEAGVERH